MTFAHRLTLWLAPPLGYACIRAVGATLRLQTLHAERVEALGRIGRPVILAFWHGRQLMLPLGYGQLPLYILISEHRDGELIHRIVRRFGFDTVRGSTTRGGVRALRQLVRLGRAGANLAVTPDGPRGPRCVAQGGVVQLAKLTGLPILPYTFAALKKKLFGSWDRFEVPLPFSRACFAWGEPISVPADADRAAIEAKRIEVETALNRLSDEADRAVHG